MSKNQKLRPMKHYGSESLISELICNMFGRQVDKAPFSWLAEWRLETIFFPLIFSDHMNKDIYWSCDNVRKHLPAITERINDA